MRPKRKIVARHIVDDIRSEMTDPELMEKYRLTSRGLQSVFRKLLDAGLLDLADVYGRTPFFDDTIEVDEIRMVPREELEFPLPIYDAQKPEIRGIVNDITERGIGVVGIGTRIDETRNFVIPADEFFRCSPVAFRARCRWVNSSDGDERGTAGFQITEVSRGDLAKLRKLIQALTFT
jgi:hypothetical protein